MRVHSWLLFPLLALGPALASEGASPRDQLYDVGVARIDITPAYPIRLSGYAVRKSESEGVAQRLWAKALAFGKDREKPALLITVDNCGVPANVRDAVVARLKKQVRPERVAICSTHTHTAPWLEGYLPNLFGGPLPPQEQAHVARYTRELVDALERLALQALADRQPARLSRGQGQAGFAANRRTRGGPVDHDLPALFVTSPAGDLRAIFASYACHGTTLGGDFNRICGDWAGYAQEGLEEAHPGVVAMIALGCAGDANPDPRTGLELAQRHGREFTGAVDRILTNAPAPLRGRLECRAQSLALPLDRLPTRAQLAEQAKLTNYLGNHARINLARLDRGEKLATSVPYLVQAWTFGDDLAMVFLAGEVVVDYSRRLKQEFDPSRLWINAYANDVPCYIPSERILREGGYEGCTSMVYYDKPTVFARGIEGLIVGAVHGLVPRQYCVQPAGAK